MEGLTFEAFTRKIYIRAPRETIYSCWATEAGLCDWFLREAVFTDPTGRRRGKSELLAKGDQYTWKWHNADVEEKGRILEANGSDTVVYSFAGDCRVRVQLRAAGPRTLVTLRQDGIPTDEESKLTIHSGCSNGWTFWLANLKAWLEHGILLHETETDLRDDPLAGYEFVNI